MSKRKYEDAKVKYYNYTKRYHVMHKGISLYSDTHQYAAREKADMINKMNREGITE